MLQVIAKKHKLPGLRQEPRCVLVSIVMFTVIMTILSPVEWSLAGSAQDRTDQPNDRKAVREVIRAFEQAWNSDDAEALSLLFSENASFTSPSGASAESRAEIRALCARERREVFVETTLTQSVTHAKFPAADQAVVEGTFELKGYQPGFGVIELSPEGTFTFRLRKQGGQWTIVMARITRT